MIRPWLTQIDLFRKKEMAEVPLIDLFRKNEVVEAPLIDLFRKKEMAKVPLIDLFRKNKEASRFFTTGCSSSGRSSAPSLRRVHRISNWRRAPLWQAEVKRAWAPVAGSVICRSVLL